MFSVLATGVPSQPAETRLRHCGLARLGYCGSATWYGNVKAVQSLAKDAFDAIDNELVFAP